MNKKTAYQLSGLFFILFLIFVFLLKNIDIRQVPDVPDTKIGFATLNNAVHSLTGVHIIWYKITDIMGIASIGVGLIFGFVAFCQLLIRKSFFKIDGYFYCLGGLYGLLGILYLAFEKLVINTRPIIMESETTAEASFPSSHTLLICAIIATAVIQLNRNIKDNRNLKLVIDIIGAIIIAVAIIGRIISGVHWITDIIASLILTTSITFLYYAVSYDMKGPLCKYNG